MGYGGIDFNPQPQESEASYLQRGLTSGVDLGLGLRRSQLLQQDNQRQEQKFQADQVAAKAQADMEKEKLQLM